MTTLYRKYRPQSWADVAGQTHVKVTLAYEAQSGRLAHAYLFSGPRGVGKTTIARILARAVNCEEIVAKRGTAEATGEPCGKCASCEAILSGETMDVIEIDAASHRGIDAVRENVIESARFAPGRLARKVFIIDEVHMLTTEAFNALLKTLEEPPAHAMFILATTELHKVPATVASRCQRFDFRKVPFEEAVERLRQVSAREGVTVDQATLEDVARASEGCLRDAESLLGKILTLGDGKEVTRDEASVVLPRSDWAMVATYVEAMLRRDARAALTVIDDALEAGLDLGEFADEAVSSLRLALLTKLSGNPEIAAPGLDEQRLETLSRWAGLADTPRLVMLLELLMEKRKEMRGAHPVQLPLELAAVRAAEDLLNLRPSQPTAPAAAAPRASAPVRPPAAPTPAPQSAPAASTPAPFVHAVTPAAAPTPTAELAPEAAPQEESAPTFAEPISVTVTAHNAAAAETCPACSLDQIAAAWPAFIREAGNRQFSLTYLLNVGKPAAVKGSVVHVEFGYPFHRDKFNQPKNRKALEEALSAAMQMTLSVEGILGERPASAHDGEDGEPFSKTGVAAPATPATAADDIAAAFGGTVVS
jgi:DNA polymerase-3 subunit gamma/tau